MTDPAVPEPRRTYYRETIRNVAAYLRDHGMSDWPIVLERDLDEFVPAPAPAAEPDGLRAYIVSERDRHARNEATATHLGLDSEQARVIRLVYDDLIERFALDAQPAVGLDVERLARAIAEAWCAQTPDTEPWWDDAHQPMPAAIAEQVAARLREPSKQDAGASVPGEDR